MFFIMVPYMLLYGPLTYDFHLTLRLTSSWNNSSGWRKLTYDYCTMYSPSPKIDTFCVCSKLEKCVNLWRVNLWRTNFWLYFPVFLAQKLISTKIYFSKRSPKSGEKRMVIFSGENRISPPKHIFSAIKAFVVVNTQQTKIFTQEHSRMIKLRTSYIFI